MAKSQPAHIVNQKAKYLEARPQTFMKTTDNLPSVVRIPRMRGEGLYQRSGRVAKRRRTNSLDATFSALADPNRRAILELLVNRKMSVTELASPFNISLPAISKHLRILESANLITRERRGRVHQLQINAQPLRPVAVWIAQYMPLWEKQLDSLAKYLESTKERKKR